MSDFFQWLSELPPEFGWGFFIVVCALMAIIPYFSSIWNFLKILFKNEKVEIIDFSWRMAKDHFLTQYQGKSYYLTSEGKDFIIEGGKIILNWKVTGAYRIDILPIGNKIKGNTALVIARKNNAHFKLIAHTIRGKIVKELKIDPSLFKQLNTFNLSQEESFKQKKHINTRDNLNTKSIGIGRYKELKNKYLGKTLSNSYLSDLKRIIVSKNTAVLKYEYRGMKMKTNKNYYFRKRRQTIYAFNPKLYNKAIENYIITKNTNHE